MKNTGKVSSILYTLIGVSVIVLIGLGSIIYESLKIGLSYVTFYMGDLISRTTLRYGIGYRAYSRLMLWSSNLDTNDRIWKTPCKEHPEVEQAKKHQRFK